MTVKMNYRKSFFEITIILLLILSSLLVYGQVRNFDFVHFDDATYVSQNTEIQQGLTVDSIIWAFTTFHAANWHPVTWVSHMLDYQLFGLNSGMHHMTSVFLHIANSLLLFFIFRKMTGNLWQSAMIAALFALHPLRVETVAWVSERKDVLSTLFWMLTLRAYLFYTDRPSGRRYAAVVLFFVLGLMSKPMLVTLPFILLLLDYWPLNRISFLPPTEQKYALAWALVREKLPLFILVVLSSVITYYAQQKGGAVASLDVIPLAERITNSIVAYIGYIWKMVYPVHLACLYPHPGMLPWWKVATSGLLIAALSAAAFGSARKYPYVIVGWLWYLGTLVPVIGIVQVGSQSMADRYTYVPAIGLFMVAVWGLPEFFKKWPWGKTFLSVGSVVILCGLTILAWHQTGYWKNSIMLFERTLEVTDDNYTMHYNLANVLARHEQGARSNEVAVKHYLEALRIKPDFADAHNNLANLYMSSGRLDAAIEQYSKALAIDPSYEGAHYNLGIAAFRQGRALEAADYFKLALQTMTDNAETYFRYGNALHQAGDGDGAVRAYQEAIHLRPDYVDAHCNLGVALFQKGDLAGAIAAFNEALRVQPDYTPARQYLRKALMAKPKE
ncbi:MAG: tetratricopeptide repeat protein [Desulfobacteraceae bacterium]|nr:MAG: tetratricopeptide repeat protein [Desulfobacteraceae bacterium]